MSKLSVDQALLKAKSHAKKGEIEEAQKLYQAVLQAFPKNKQAQQSLAALNKPKQSTANHALTIVLDQSDEAAHFQSLPVQILRPTSQRPRQPHYRIRSK